VRVYDSIVQRLAKRRFKVMCLCRTDVKTIHKLS
jgi:hypothetical protein